jgi:esterase/lipase superfamily enzyme
VKLPTIPASFFQANLIQPFLFAACHPVSAGGTWRGLLLTGFLVMLVWMPGDPVFATDGGSQSGESSPNGKTATDATELIDVLYLTNRAVKQQDSTMVVYDSGRGDPHVGRCQVRFSPIAMADSLAEKLPFYLETETREIRFFEQPDRSLFMADLDRSVGESVSGSVVLFVHGYNYSIERACRMASEMQRALGNEATMMLFSWPSNGLPSDYVSDLNDVEWSVPILAGFLEELASRSGISGLRIVAHSMGSRGVIRALQLIAARNPAEAHVDNLVLLAPDYDSATFVDLLPIIRPAVGNITVYASDNDTLLKLSKQLSGYPRLGQAGEYLTVVEGVETIDVSSTGRYQITGHEYFFFNPNVASDLVLLLGRGISASARPGLESRSREGQTYWKIR